jgi:hypothetical protein
MLRKLTKSACLLLGWAAAQQAGAFSLWGPLETWQTADLDYGTRYYYRWVDATANMGASENGGPKNFGEGSRLATPIVTYGFDITFLEYFGAQGVAAVDSAMRVFNALPPASSININNYLTEGNEQINYTAEAGSLVDIKSTVMWLVIEHMGLLGETHIFDLHSRMLPPAAPPCGFDYLVINRNWDPVTYDPSVYVNGRQYGYWIWDGCPAGVDVGDAIEIPYDSEVTRFTAVATPETLQLGGYYLGLTQDDVAGLKYLYSKDNFILQGLDSNSVAEPFESSWSPVNTTNASSGAVSNFFGLLGGVEKVTFVKVNFDPLLGTNFAPIIYNYKIPWIDTNGRLSQLSVQRTVNTPDILFTATDLNPVAVPLYDPPLTRSGSFILSPYVSPGAGITGSTITANMLVVLNDVGALFYNNNPYFMDSTNYDSWPIFIWGSFDGTTNAPIVYPTGTSIQYLEEQILEGGATVPPGSWAPVFNPNTNSAAGGTGPGGGVAGAGG